MPGLPELRNHGSLRPDLWGLLPLLQIPWEAAAPLFPFSTAELPSPWTGRWLLRCTEDSNNPSGAGVRLCRGVHTHVYIF